MKHKIYPYKIYSLDSIVDIKKYNGKKLSEIMLIDPRYVEWCISNHSRFCISPETLFALNDIYYHKYRIRYEFEIKTLLILCYKYDSMIFLDLNYNDVIKSIEEKAIHLISFEDKKSLLDDRISYNKNIYFSFLQKSDVIPKHIVYFKAILTNGLDYNAWKLWLLENNITYNYSPSNEYDIKYGVITQIVNQSIYQLLYCVNYSNSSYSHNLGQKIKIRGIEVNDYLYILRSNGCIMRYLLEHFKEIIYQNNFTALHTIINNYKFTNKKTKINSINEFGISKLEDNIYFDFKITDKTYDSYNRYYYNGSNHMFLEIPHVYEARIKQQLNMQNNEYNSFADDSRHTDWMEDNFDALTDGQYGSWKQWRGNSDELNDALGF